MPAYTRHEKSLAMMAADACEVCDHIAAEMKRQDWAITQDETMRVIYQRVVRARQELDAARHFVARMQAAPTATVRPARPVEDDFTPKP